MTPTARPDTPPADAARSQPLAVATALARLLADAAVATPAAPERAVEALLDTLRAALAATACSLWAAEDGALARVAGAGAATAADVERGLAADGDDVGTTPGMPVVLPVRAAGRPAGALVIEAERPLDDDGRRLAGIGADLLASLLAGERRRRALEDELATRARQIDEQRGFIERVVDSLPMSLYVVDREFRVQLWNRTRESGLQGVSRGDAVGRPIFDILFRQPADRLRGELEEVLRTGEVQHYTMESNATGEPRHYRISKIPMRAGGGAVTHVITVGEDVTEWRAAQERFAQGEKLAAIGQLAAGVMHEINNPLATIGACAESLRLALRDARDGGAPAPAECGEYLRIVESEVHRSKHIVDRLLEFSRPKPLEPEPVDLNALVEQTLFLLKHHARFKTFTVRTALAEPPPVAYGNGEQLVQVLMALLLNAMDASETPGYIEVRTRAGDHGLVLEVRDRGHGIPRSHLSKLFEPFYTTKGPGRGTGLGLSICYSIVAEHGGRLEVESLEGAGSSFRVLLPAARRLATPAVASPPVTPDRQGR